MTVEKREERVFYVSNKKLYAEYLVWYENIKLAELEGIEEPPIPDFVVDSMIRIANRLAYKPNFINYSYRDDMISDALYDCVRFAKKFKLTYVDKGGTTQLGNPFSYITTICFNAYLRRIDKEKTQKYIKAKIISESDHGDFLDTHAHEDGTDFVNQYVEFLRNVGSIDESAPMSVKRIKKLKEEKLNGPLDGFNE